MQIKIFSRRISKLIIVLVNIDEQENTRKRKQRNTLKHKNMNIQNTFEGLELDLYINPD